VNPGSWLVAAAAPLPAEMTAVVFVGPGEVGHRTVPLPAPAPGRALLRVAFVGICGTDTHLLAGTSPYVTDGLTRYPIRFGHEYSGTVVAVADDQDLPLIGARVTGDGIVSCGQCPTCKSGRYNLCPRRDEIGVKGDFPGAAAQYFSVPVTNLAVVPDRLDLRAAPLAEPTVTVLSALEAGGLQPGRQVAVIGTGALGLVATQLASGAGCAVTVIGIEDPGLEAALRAGATAAITPDRAPKDTFDLVLEMSGARSIGGLLTRIAAAGGSLVQVGISGGPVDGVRLSDFTAKGLRLTGVLGGVHRVRAAVDLLAAGRIDTTLLVDEVVPAADAAHAFDRIGEPGRARPQVLIEFLSDTSHKER
jgi:2-desacetyl-2-hydroxyethyl bacteriochlorophyllide A dehydrogenase